MWKAIRKKKILRIFVEFWKLLFKIVKWKF
jgi:hypothetical protein